ncbi:MAG: phosphoglycerate kinase [Candidatus Omnitrophota bacterium]|nr:MAG: phosphoglycerate kinase [Candidatus Omnitrophota bacterium]
MTKKTIKDIDIQGKKVLMRVDFNVPLDENLKITDDTRIKAALPTIKYALEKNARLILMSHLGRPKGKVVDAMRLTPVGRRLGELLGQEVKVASDCVGADVKNQAEALKEKEILLLENTRFHKEETDNDPTFAKELASLAEVYVSDAFGSVHRAHASTEGVARLLPSAAGFLLEKEIKYLGKVVTKPDKPFALILGGAKVADKIELINNLMDKVDLILIGGGMAYTFLKAQGKPIGASKLEQDKIGLAKELLAKAEESEVELHLPIDNVIADSFSASAKHKVVGEDIPDGWMALDVGPKTTENFISALKVAKTVVWNGPLGVSEWEPFSHASRKLAEFLANTPDITSIIGGGDTAAAVAQFGLSDKMSHVSTGGGASLELLEGKNLPGIAVLQDK